MADSLSDQANRAALAQVRAEKPSSFTVGGHFDGKKIVGGITYDRTLTNLWGITAYARAYWNDEPVSVGRKRVRAEAGAEITRRF